MRRIILLVILLVLAAPAAAQSGQRTASPPIVTVELSGIEPRPPDYPTELFYGGLGGGGGAPIIPNGVYWQGTPGAFTGASDSYFSACGYTDMTQAPVATLTLPDGSTQTITATDSDASSHCYSYRIPWSYGMQLGLYTLQLDHPDGQLTHTWGIDYPFCRTSILNDNLQWLMGFAPGEQLTVVFFASINSDQPVFAATRSVQADDQGTLALDIKVARGAPFTREDLVIAVIGPQREIYYPTFGGLDISPFLDLGYSLPSVPIPKPLYLTYTLKGSPIAPGFSACDGEFDNFVIATPQQGNVPLYADVNNLTPVGQITAGAPAQVLENRPAMTNGRVLVWKHLLTEDGTQGWSASLDFTEIYTQLVPGAHAEAEEPAFYDAQTDVYHPGSPALYTSPDFNAQHNPVNVGATLIALGYRVVGDQTWWYVRLDGGGAGWMPQTNSNNDNVCPNCAALGNCRCVRARCYLENLPQFAANAPHPLQLRPGHARRCE